MTTVIEEFTCPASAEALTRALKDRNIGVEYVLTVILEEHRRIPIGVAVEFEAKFRVLWRNVRPELTGQ